MSFDDFATGGPRCVACSRIIRRQPRDQFVQGPHRRQPAAAASLSEEDDYERMLDSIPDELIDELVAALEAEAAKRPVAQKSPVMEVLADIGIGHSPKERHWAVWGFAGGFAANVALAKYAQMATGASLGEFLGPLLVGGVVAGVCCAAIGWGVARLREPA